MSALDEIRALDAALDAGMVVLNHWREALLDLHEKYPDKGFAAGSHALACVDAALHGSDEVGIGEDEPAWQKFQDARTALTEALGADR